MEILVLCTCVGHRYKLLISLIQLSFIPAALKCFINACIAKILVKLIFFVIEILREFSQILELKVLVSIPLRRNQHNECKILHNTKKIVS